jgi:hypothetical protein
MLVQIAVGTLLLVANIVIASIGALALEVAFQRGHSWLLREPHAPKLVLTVAGVSVWVLGVITAGVWLWATIYLWLGAFPNLETSVYFSLVMFTTLGLGDVILPLDWRILAGMEAANGFLTFGLLTALLGEALRQVRLRQVETRSKDRSRDSH